MPPFQRLDSTVGESSDHIPPPDANDDSEPFFPNPGEYHDKFIDIDPETKTLTIKKYFIAMSTRRIHVPNISYITPASNLYRIGVRIHGVSLTGIIWALDWSRGVLGSKTERSFVIKVKGDTFRAGFSVEHRERFLEALEYLHPGITTRSNSGIQDVNEVQSQSEGNLIESD